MSEPTRAVGAPLERPVGPHSDGGAAFPVLPPCGMDGSSASGYPYPEAGMSLRDYFAAKAMQMEMKSARKLYVSGALDADEWRQVQVWVADYAYEMADEMLRARGAVRAPNVAGEATTTARDDD